MPEIDPAPYEPQTSTPEPEPEPQPEPPSEPPAEETPRPVGENDETDPADSDQGSGGPCLVLTNGDDRVIHDGLTTCYNFKQSDDVLVGGHAVLDLHVKAAKDADGRGSLVTGSGHDRIVTQQSGRLWTGAGDDDINMIIMDSANIFDVSLGAGADKLHLNVDHASTNQRLGSLDVGGGGRKDVKAHCKKGGVIDLALGTAAVATMDGSCAFKASGDPAASVDATFSGQTSLSGDLSGRFRVRADIAPKYNQAPLNVDLIEAREFVWKAAYPNPVEIALRGSGPATEVPLLSLHVSAPSGRITLADLPAAGWPAAIDMPSGELHLSARAPREAMPFPKITGSVRSLHLGGCYDLIEILAAALLHGSR